LFKSYFRIRIEDKFVLEGIKNTEER
jgi:hypothetical protein